MIIYIILFAFILNLAASPFPKARISVHASIKTEYIRRLEALKVSSKDPVLNHHLDTVIDMVKNRLFFRGPTPFPPPLMGGGVGSSDPALVGLERPRGRVKGLEYKPAGALRNPPGFNEKNIIPFTAQMFISYSNPKIVPRIEEDSDGNLIVIFEPNQNLKLSYDPNHGFTAASNHKPFRLLGGKAWIESLALKSNLARALNTLRRKGALFIFHLNDFIAEFSYGLRAGMKQNNNNNNNNDSNDNSENFVQNLQERLTNIKKQLEELKITPNINQWEKEIRPYIQELDALEHKKLLNAIEAKIEKFESMSDIQIIGLENLTLQLILLQRLDKIKTKADELEKLNTNKDSAVSYGITQLINGFERIYTQLGTQDIVELKNVWDDKQRQDQLEALVEAQSIVIILLNDAVKSDFKEFSMIAHQLLPIAELCQSANLKLLDVKYLKKLETDLIAICNMMVLLDEIESELQMKLNEIPKRDRKSSPFADFLQKCIRKSNSLKILIEKQDPNYNEKMLRITALVHTYQKKCETFIAKITSLNAVIFEKQEKIFENLNVGDMFKEITKLQSRASPSREQPEEIEKFLQEKQKNNPQLSQLMENFKNFEFQLDTKDKNLKKLREVLDEIKQQQQTLLSLIDAHAPELNVLPQEVEIEINELKAKLTSIQFISDDTGVKTLGTKMWQVQYLQAQLEDMKDIISNKESNNDNRQDQEEKDIYEKIGEILGKDAPDWDVKK